MIWNSASTGRIFCTMVVIIFCAGCASIDAVFNPREGHVDLSDSASAGVATIRGSTWDIGVASVDCWIKYPANAKRVRVNAGIVDIFAVCKSIDMGSDLLLENAAFHFEALAGHEYEISQRTCKECIQLRDATANEVVAESPHNPLGRGADLSTGDNTATIREFTGGNNYGCWLTDERVDFLVVDAGPVTIDLNCTLASLNHLFQGQRMTSSFDFEAETGHTYKVSIRGVHGKEKCISLLDITSEEMVIACEPYENVE